MDPGRDAGGDVRGDRVAVGREEVDASGGVVATP